MTKNINAIINSHTKKRIDCIVAFSGNNIDRIMIDIDNFKFVASGMQRAWNDFDSVNIDSVSRGCDFHSTITWNNKKSGF